MTAKGQRDFGYHSRGHFATNALAAVLCHTFGEPLATFSVASQTGNARLPNTFMFNGVCPMPVGSMGNALEANGGRLKQSTRSFPLHSLGSGRARIESRAAPRL